MLETTITLVAAVGTLLSATAALLLVRLNRHELTSLESQVKHSGDQAEAAASAVVAAQTSAEAAQDAVREAARTRADDVAPRVVALMEAPPWPPLVDRTRSGMPGGNDLRLLHPRSLAASQQATEAQPFVFDRDRKVLMWFHMRGFLINEGRGTARVILGTEARFVEGETPYADGHIPVPPQVGTARDQQHLLRPGDKAIFEWGYGHTLEQWADAYENPHPPNPLGACFFSIVVLDSYASGVTDHLHVVMAGRPIAPVRGATGQWQLADNHEDALGLVIYPTQRSYRAEDRKFAPPPWQKTYAEWTEQHSGG